MNITMSREAREHFLRFGRGWHWPGNFRDLGGAVTRMSTFAEGGRITVEVVEEEIARLALSAPATAPAAGASEGRLEAVLGKDGAAQLDRFDRVQLADVLAVCTDARSLSAAGRTLFAQSRTTRSSVNDADRLRKYLARFELTFQDVAQR